MFSRQDLSFLLWIPPILFVLKYNMMYGQLSKAFRSGHVFDGWKEGVIDFAPTYKYEINSDRYVGENLKEGEKKRSPAW